MGVKACYLRISQDRDGERLGVERQWTACVEHGNRIGWAQLTPYEDNDLGAWAGKRRPAYDQLLADITAGLVDGLVVYNLDRLTRHPKELEHFIDVVAAAQLTAIYTVAGDIDLATPDGQLHARILGAFAKKESDNLSRRLKARYEADRAAGLPSNRGRRPYGYTADRMGVDPTEAAQIASWAGQVLAGRSLHRLAREANETGVQTVTGKPWRHTTIRQLLLSPRIAGLVSQGRGNQIRVIGRAAWPAVIDEATHHALHTLLGRPSTQPAPRTRYLTGILHCADHPRQAMTANGNGRRIWYECRRQVGGCGRAIDAHRVEEQVRDTLFTLDDQTRARAHLEVPSIAPDASEVRRLQADIDELIAAKNAGQFPNLRDWMRLYTPAVDRLQQAETRAVAARAEQARRVKDPAEPLRNQWDDMTIQRRHDETVAYFPKLYVKQGGGGPYNPERVTPTPEPPPAGGATQQPPRHR